MTPFEMRHRRRKGEDLISYLTRVIATECQSDIPGVHEDMIAEALNFHRVRVEQYVEDAERQRAESDQRHLQARLADLNERHQKLEADYTALLANIPRSVSIRQAEEARLGAFRRAINAASILAEKTGGVPSELSVAIENIPLPKPKWS